MILTSCPWPPPTDLTCLTFEAWLVHTGLEPAPHPSHPTPTATAAATAAGSVAAAGLDAAQRVELRSLWLRAKEARELQALVETMKESELEMAQREAEESAQYLDALVGPN